MKAKALVIFAILALFLSLVAVLAPPLARPVSAATWYVNPGESIQDAIDAASPGDTIIVRDGTYTENIDVNKGNLTIQSENGAKTTIVHAVNPDDHVFHVTSDNVTVRGLGIYGATEVSNYIAAAGICLYGTNGCTIENNRCGWDDTHDNLIGIRVVYSGLTKILGNTCNNNSYGIHLYGSTDDTLSGNTANSNTYGIYLDGGGYNSISDNVCRDNDTGIYLEKSIINTLQGNAAEQNSCGISLGSSSGNTISGNTCNDNGTGIELTDAWSFGTYLGPSYSNSILGNTVSHNGGRGILLCHGHISLTNNIISGNVVNDNGSIGIYIWGSRNNTVSDNTVNNNDGHGIYLGNGSDDNTFTGNIIDENSSHGIQLWKSSDNTIYLNNFKNNTTGNAGSTDSTNIWNSPEQITYTYNGSTYTNYLGNYWSDYTGADDGYGGRTAGDGIGDTEIPHATDGIGDNYPLMEPIEKYLIVSCGDVDGMPGVTMNDGRQIFMNLIYGEEQYPLCDPWAADCDGSQGITMNDGRQIFMYLIYGADDYPLVCY